MTKSPKLAALNVTVTLGKQQTVTHEDGAFTVHIPITFKRHGGRKYIIAPDSLPEAFTPPAEKESLLKAIGQAFEWKAMLDEGKAATMTELATKAKVNLSYLARVLRLTLLAPDIIEAILCGKQPKTLSLLDIFRSMPYDWSEQRQQYGFANRIE